MTLLLFSAAFALACARAAVACSCGAKPTVLDSFERSDVVVVARAVSVEKTERAAPPGRMSDGRNYVDGVRSTTMLVERVYKGNVRAGDEMVFAQGGGADCVWTFNEKSVGARYLFYLTRLKGAGKLWLAFSCGRSNLVEHAHDDLLYLDKLGKVRGRTRLSGTIEFEDYGQNVSVAGRLVRVVGASKTYEARTDAHGVYELYDLPPGRYSVEPEVPSGWRVAPFWLDYSPSYAGRRDLDYWATVTKIPVTLGPGSHASLDIHFSIDNGIYGRVLDTAGRPMRGVCVDAVAAHAGEDYGYHADCTEEDGVFRIRKLPPGDYLLVANKDDRPSGSEPFGTIYYPNVPERERAGVIHVGVGDRLEDFDIRVPREEPTVTIEGVLLYSDGKPVADEVVNFKAAGAPANVDGDARSSTDARGRFRLRVLKGLAGEVSGGMYSYVGEFENCPKLEAVIRRGGGTSGEARTPALEVWADADIDGLELKFPFPSCRKAKE